jgi:hypothetical protein
MSGQPSGGFEPSGAVELRAQCSVSPEQTRAEATRSISSSTSERHGARQRAVQALCASVLYELFGCAELRSHTTLPSLFALLDARMRKCAPERGELSALAPCPEVNAALGRLVAIIQGDHELDRELEQAVRLDLVQRIQAEPRLRARAHRLRSIAGVAETAMEQHYSQALLAQLSEVQRPLGPQPAGGLRTELLERCLVNFPYTRNYRLLTAAELRLLQHPAPPLLIRSTHWEDLSRAQRQRLEAELAQLRLRVARRELRELSWHKQTFAVCGAGPLPVTGLMLHTLTGARVSLIERDARAVEMSRALVVQLERLQVLERGAVSVVHADVAELTPRAEVVLVASLVDNAAKLQLTERLRVGDRAPGFHALLLRSAGSLCAELAYEPIETLCFTDPSLPFCGESVPATDVAQRTERLVRSAREVLNNTELYRPVQHSAAAASWLRELIVQLRAAA